jgi:hypothetical protein
MRQFVLPDDTPPMKAARAGFGKHSPWHPSGGLAWLDFWGFLIGTTPRGSTTAFKLDS